MSIKWIHLTYFLGLLRQCMALNIAVIGAGASGLASAKNILEQDHKVDIFEKSSVLGGIWYYTNKTQFDDYGVRIHSPMYFWLRTNTPYQSMEFPGFKFPEHTDSFPTHNVVWQYLDSYAKHFHINKHIKYQHLVTKVRSISNKKWEVTVHDLPNNKSVSSTYDAVFVCTGVCSSPFIPKIRGADGFKGRKMHSHDYRIPETFEGENVLVIGGGPSGNDIVTQLYQVVNQITQCVSSNTPKESLMKLIIERARGLCTNCFAPTSLSRFQSFRKDVSYKKGIKCFTKNGAEFEDRSRKNFTTVIYATGYVYSYPFLDKNSGIQTNGTYVKPLYKQILNIKHPSMAFIGIPTSVAHNPMYDLQARFALKYISGAKTLPSNEEMKADSEKIAKQKKTHLLGLDHKAYYNELAETAEIDNNIPEVISNILTDTLLRLDSSGDFRNNEYVIIDDQNFEIINEH